MKSPQFILVQHFGDRYYVGAGYRLGYENYFCDTPTRTQSRAAAAKSAAQLKASTGLTRVVGAHLLTL